MATFLLGDVVEVDSNDGKFVAYYRGEKEHNGKIYRIVSPYSDDRNHWLDIDTPIKTIVSYLHLK